MRAWDLYLALKRDLWHTCFNSACKGVLNISLVEANVKVMTRWYMVPLWPFYFRSCHSNGSTYHIWRECPKLQSFENRVFALNRRVLGAPVPQLPRVALLLQGLETSLGPGSASSSLIGVTFLDIGVDLVSHKNSSWLTVPNTTSPAAFSDSSSSGKPCMLPS